MLSMKQNFTMKVFFSVLLVCKCVSSEDYTEGKYLPVLYPLVTFTDLLRLLFSFHVTLFLLRKANPPLGVLLLLLWRTFRTEHLGDSELIGSGSFSCSVLVPL